MAESTSSFNIEQKSITKSVDTNSDNILSICVLSDGRIATSTFAEVVIYNLDKNNVDIVINENIEEVSYLFLMQCGYLFSSATEECIIYEINENSYEIIQKLGGLFGDTSKAYEMTNGNIIVLSKGFYVFKKDPAQNLFSLEKTVTNENFLSDVVEVNDNQVVIANKAKNQLIFWKIEDWSVAKEINDIKVGPYNNCLYKYDSSNLIVGGDHIVYLVDLNTFNIKQSLENKYEIFSICPVNDKIFLTTGNEGTITQWNFEDGKITKQHEKENLANEECLCMIYLDNGKILLGDARKLVIIE